MLSQGGCGTHLGAISRRSLLCRDRIEGNTVPTLARTLTAPAREVLIYLELTLDVQAITDGS
jgi:hypothetical protein